MAIERKWERQGTLLFIADGGADGLVTLNSVECFKVKQKVVLSSATKPDLLLEVKKVISATRLLVGPIKDKQNPKGNLLARTDISAYTIADGAGIRASEQDKVRLKPDDIWAAIYEQEPTVALRMFSVDKIGKPWDIDNPFPVQLSEGSVNIGYVNAEIEVQLSHKDNTPDAGDVADSTQIGDGEEILQINPDGGINIALHDENGQKYDADNPLPVTLEESEGDEINDFKVSSSIVKDDIVTHNYTVSVTKTFVGDQVWITGSGKIKVEVQVETAAASGIFITKFVAFNSTANTNILIPLKKRYKALTGVMVRIKITNKDNQPQDVYSTLTGIEK